MPKIQNVGVGNYIRNPKGIKGVGSRQMNIETLKVVSNEGNSFKCVPVINGSVDMSRYYFIPVDTYVEQVTI